MKFNKTKLNNHILLTIGGAHLWFHLLLFKKIISLSTSGNKKVHYGYKNLLRGVPDMEIIP